jgi:hypothetical protein
MIIVVNQTKSNSSIRVYENCIDPADYYKFNEIYVIINKIAFIKYNDSDIIAIYYDQNTELILKFNTIEEARAELNTILEIIRVYSL